MREPGRWQRLADLLREVSEGVDVGPEVAALAARVLGVDEVAMLLVIDDALVSAVGGDEAVALCRREFSLGEGPSVAAARSGLPMLLDDLEDGRAHELAPVLVSAAATQGVAALFAFPLRIGGALMGVMTGLRRSPGPLDAEQFADGLVLSMLVTLVHLEREATLRHRAPGATDAPRVLHEALGDAVQIAAGMVSEQLDAPVVEALVRIRAHAFLTDATYEEVARRIVARELRLER